jgi:hypothetical protein
MALAAGLTMSKVIYGLDLSRALLHSPAFQTSRFIAQKLLRLHSNVAYERDSVTGSSCSAFSWCHGSGETILKQVR